MALQHPIRSLTSFPTLFRFASALATNASCPLSSRPLALCAICQRPYRRPLSTATAYQPYTLVPAPPPPRNTNIPDTSIAGISPEIKIKRPTPPTDQDDATSAAGQQERPSFSLSQHEAQKSKPVSFMPSTSDPASPTERSKRPSRLRARKAAITLTPDASSQIRNLLSLPEPKYIRVAVKNRGCSGLAYHLEYVDKAGTFDETVDQDGVKVLIDSKALFSIIGSEMDWVEDKLSQRFVFRNPNIKEQCGCGESFMV